MLIWRMYVLKGRSNNKIIKQNTMAKIKIFWNDLTEETKEEIWEAVKQELQEEIKEAQEASQKDTEDVENEVIDDYINRNNSGVFFEV